MDYHINGQGGTFRDYIFSHEADLKKELGSDDVTLNKDENTITYKQNIFTVNEDGSIEAVDGIALTDTKKTLQIVDGTAATVTAKAKNSGKTTTATITVTAPAFANYTWTEINALAKEIAKDSTITKDTDTVTKTINGKSYTATVGAKKTITIDEKDYTVRILGFNHDTLENGQTAYGDASITKAGISFEFETLLPGAKMNSSSTNSGGWEASLMRTNLNSTTAVDGMTNLSNIESVIGSNIIKSVTKSYIKTYNNGGSVTTCNDKLWLLACSEIWNNGYNGDGTYGYAKASEGDQYKYYADINATYNSSNSKLYKMYQGSTSSSWWWLRSPYYSDGDSFCYVNGNGFCGWSYANYTNGVAPGFAI